MSLSYLNPLVDSNHPNFLVWYLNKGDRSHFPKITIDNSITKSFVLFCLLKRKKKHIVLQPDFSFSLPIFFYFLLLKSSNQYKNTENSIRYPHVPITQLQQISTIGQFCSIYLSCTSNYFPWNIPANLRHYSISP